MADFRINAIILLFKICVHIVKWDLKQICLSKL